LLGAESKRFNVIDFGGGSGWLYHSLLSVKFPFQSYTVVESEDLHKSCREKHKNYMFISTRSLYAVLPQEEGVLYLNSVVQYLESDEILYRLINQIKPKYLLLDDVTFSKRDEFFAFQKYYEEQIPHRFLNKITITQRLAALGFTLLRELPFERTISSKFSYSLENIDSKFEIGETVSLLFTSETNL
jgi:putative methyltransferase (TIGR04325 family)